MEMLDLESEGSGTRGRETYQRDGFVLIRSTAEDFRALVQQAFRTAEETAAGMKKGRANWTMSDGSFKHFMDPHESDAAFRGIVHSSTIQKCIDMFYGPQLVYITHSKISYKMAGKNHQWLPHQDYGYKGSDLSGTTFGVFLERCDTGNGTLEVYPRSHLLGGLPHHYVHVNGESKPQLCVKEVPDIKPLSVLAEQGDVLAFDYKTLHQSGENRTGGNRSIFLFEVQPVKFLALNDNGRRAMVLNGSYPEWKGHVSTVYGAMQITGRWIYGKAVGLRRRLLKPFATSRPPAQ
jgi:ectoine hydroxylase-related dioxygenase (phytanoyl-CoA dioxygenase family)